MSLKQKIYLFSGLGLVIAILLIGGIVKPLLAEIKTTSILVEERNGKLGELEKTDQEYLKQLEADYTDIKQNISLIKSGFLDPNQAVNFFIDLEEIAESTSNDLKIEASEFPLFTIHLLGDFPGLMKFLGWLENSKHFLDINSIKIVKFAEKELFSNEPELEKTGKIKTVLNIRSYIQEQKYENKENLKTY